MELICNCYALSSFFLALLAKIPKKTCTQRNLNWRATQHVADLGQIKSQEFSKKVDKFYICQVFSSNSEFFSTLVANKPKQLGSSQMCDLQFLDIYANIKLNRSKSFTARNAIGHIYYSLRASTVRGTRENIIHISLISQ